MKSNVATIYRKHPRSHRQREFLFPFYCMGPAIHSNGEDPWQHGNYVHQHVLHKSNTINRLTSIYNTLKKTGQHHGAK